MYQVQDEIGHVQNLVIHSCPDCGVLHAIPEDIHNQQKNGERKGIYCPNGHIWIFCKTKNQEINELKARIAHKDEQIDHYLEQRNSAERSARAYRGHLTRTRNRIAKGTCPCCHRHFDNLQKHMENKHPNYGNQEA